MKTLTIRLIALSIATLASTAAFAEETVCRGTLGPRAFDNIFVPDNASCTLNRSRANGNIVVGRGASLQANGVRINGSVQAEGALFVGIGPNSQIGGSVQIKQGGGASITGARINGDIQFDENQLPLAATDNLVGGNVQVVKNSGGVTLERNRIDSALQCKENQPAPVGGQNLASSKEDQCAAL
ncbi:MAG: hypothetical protein ACRC2H_06665 [Silanimonas sp.]|jgi:hypothetical protein